MREFKIEQKGSIVTCWTTDKPYIGFQFDKRDPMAQHCIGIWKPANTTVGVELFCEFIEFARMKFPTIFYDQNPKCGVEQVELR